MGRGLKERAPATAYDDPSLNRPQGPESGARTGAGVDSAARGAAIPLKKTRGSGDQRGRRRR
jgi:hypothetical protein